MERREMTTPSPTPAAEPAWVAYERLKAEFLATHPDATPDEIEAECRRLVDMLGL
jgi:hypothetical protein